MSERKAKPSTEEQLEAGQQAPADATRQDGGLLQMRALHRRWVHRKAERAAAADAARIPEGQGAPLDAGVQQTMNPHFGGADLSQVRVHTGADSATAATQLGARAFTVGQDVHFGAGQYAPGTREGDHLLAHELTHVAERHDEKVHLGKDELTAAERRLATIARHLVPQGNPTGGGQQQAQLGVSSTSDPNEHQAEKKADDVTGALHGGDSTAATAARRLSVIANHLAPPQLDGGQLHSQQASGQSSASTARPEDMLLNDPRQTTGDIEQRIALLYPRWVKDGMSPQLCAQNAFEIRKSAGKTQYGSFAVAFSAAAAFGMAGDQVYNLIIQGFEPPAEVVGGDHSAFEEQQHAIEQLSCIPVAVTPGVDGVAGDRMTYYVTTPDATRMIALLQKLPEVRVRDFPTGFTIHHNGDDWHFQRYEYARAVAERQQQERAQGAAQESALESQGTRPKEQGQNNESKQQGPGRSSIGLPTANAAIVELHGYSGVRNVQRGGKVLDINEGRGSKKTPADSLAPAEDRAIEKQIRQLEIDPLLWAGHIGLSVDGGKTIYGFTPEMPEGTTPEQQMELIKSHTAFPGVAQDDTASFKLADKYARERGWNTWVVVSSQRVTAPEKLRTIRELQRLCGMTENTGSGSHGHHYAFPDLQPRDGQSAEESSSYYHPTDDRTVKNTTEMVHPKNIGNCGVFPAFVGVRIPEPSGHLVKYMPKLATWAKQSPMDMRKQPVQEPRPRMAKL